MKRIITYLIVIATILAFIIKTHHFNWLLPVGIISAIGLLLIVFYNIGEEAKINAEIDRQIEEEERLEREKNTPKIEPIEYYENTKTPKAVVDWYKSEHQFMRDEYKLFNATNAPDEFYFISYNNIKYYATYDYKLQQYKLPRFSQSYKMTNFKEIEIGIYRYNFNFDPETDTLSIYW